MKQPRKRTTNDGTATDTPTGRKRPVRKSVDMGDVGANGHSVDSASMMSRGDEEIRVRAYEIFLERGGEPGRELDDWLRAERECERQSRAIEREERSASPGF